MEKRFLIAIILSFAVLYIWAAMTPKPTPSPRAFDGSQLVENEEFTENTSIEDAPMAEFSKAADKDLTVADVELNSGEITVLETDKLIVAFSDIGGSIEGVTLREYNTSLPVTKIGDIIGYDDVKFFLTEQSHNEVTYTYENLDYRIVKSYQLLDDDYIIDSNIRIENKSDMSKLTEINVKGFLIDTARLDNNQNGGLHKRNQALLEYVIYANKQIKRKNNAYKFSLKNKETVEGSVHWVGFRDQYFSMLVAPAYETSGYSVDDLSEKKLQINIKTEKIALPRGGSINLASKIFIGPEKWGLLKSQGLEFERIKKYYKFWLLDGIALFIDRLMDFCYKVIPNWGICIIIISILIYFSMYPLTMRGMSSMKRMQAMQPEMTKIREKYKDNPKKMNQEMMGFYKKNKINPLGGCLPLLLQMPVFIGLYQVLWRSVSFKGAGFLWIKDLSEPDRLMILPFKLPFIGNELNLLPILMMGIMFLQTKFQARNMTITDPAQATQQKMMATIMPVFLGVIFYKFASGLTLYFTMFYMFSTFTQWKMSKGPKVA